MHCKYCALELNEDNCYPSDWKRGGYICKECRKKSYKKNVSNNKESLYCKNKLLSLKEKIFEEYGNKCECCGETIWQFLSVDHIDNTGAEHRKIIGKRGGKIIYQWLKNNNYPKDGFRLLCMNCNACIGFHGFCIHKINKNRELCNNCNIILTEDNQFEFHKINKTSLCKICTLEKSRKHKNIEDKVIGYKSLLQRRKENKTYTLNIRRKLIEGYGGKCECCKESEYMFLTIDHINNDGAKERKEFSNDMGKFYRKLIESNYPKDNYRLLCYNCNCCRSSYGKCYHQLINELKIDKISFKEYKKGICND